MTDWQHVVDAEYAVPEGEPLPGLVAELSEALRSPDPALRDGPALSVLGNWIENGTLDAATVTGVGDVMAERLGDPEIQARTFAPLILDCAVSIGYYRPQWLETFAAWYPAETDLRGHDAKLGWLHAVAHGADALMAFGRHPEVDPARMLSIAADRLVAPTEYVWRDQEDDRLAFAIAQVLTRPELDESGATGWLTAIEAMFASGAAGPPPPHASNAMRTLRALYLLADRGVRSGWRGGDAVHVRYRERVRERLAEVLACVAPFTG